MNWKIIYKDLASEMDRREKEDRDKFGDLIGKPWRQDDYAKRKVRKAAIKMARNQKK